MRPEAHTCRDRPGDYLRRIWFDSLVYTSQQLDFLIRQAGVSQVVLGSDYLPVERLDAVSGLSNQDRASILGLNAARLIGIESPEYQISQE